MPAETKVGVHVVCVRHTPTETNLADTLTKVLPRTTLERLCQSSKLGDYHVSNKAERECVLYVFYLNTWMTKSVYYGRVGCRSSQLREDC